MEDELLSEVWDWNNCAAVVITTSQPPQQQNRFDSPLKSSVWPRVTKRRNSLVSLKSGLFLVSFSVSSSSSSSSRLIFTGIDTDCQPNIVAYLGVAWWCCVVVSPRWPLLVGRPPFIFVNLDWLTGETVWCLYSCPFAYLVALLIIFSLNMNAVSFLLLLSFHCCSPPLILLLHHSKSAITNCRQIAGVEREEGTLSFFFPFHFFSLYHLTRVTWWTTSTDAPTELRARENWMLLLSPCYQFSLLACHLVVTSSSCFSIPKREEKKQMKMRHKVSGQLCVMCWLMLLLPPSPSTGASLNWTELNLKLKLNSTLTSLSYSLLFTLTTLSFFFYPGHALKEAIAFFLFFFSRSILTLEH